MKSKQTYRREPLPKHEGAYNDAGKVAKNNVANFVDEGDEIASVSKKKQALRYFEGRSKAGKNDPYMPSQASAIGDAVEAGDPGKGDYPPYPGGPGNDLAEIRDLSTKKPYGRSGMGWSENTGKLGDLDPQEKDQPSWVNTWSECLVGEEKGNGVGVTLDENYYVDRPRTFSRQEEAFKEYNPEFQDVADHGDWTSLKWDRNV